MLPRPFFRTLALTAIAGLTTLGVSAPGFGTPPPSSSQILGQQLFTVTQNVLPGLANATGLGKDTTSVLHLVVQVKRPDEAGEERLMAAEHDPSSASYQQFLKSLAVRHPLRRSRCPAPGRADLPHLRRPYR